MAEFKVIAGKRASSKTDEQAFTQLYMESYSVVYNYVRRRMNGSDAAEDVVAEAYLLAARSFGRFDPKRAKFSTWVTQIAINCMASHFRRERELASLDELPDVFFSEDTGQDAIESQELVAQLLSTLDEDELKLVLMKYRDDMRNVDIASELGMNPSTVSTMLSRAMAKMRAAHDGALRLM